MCTCPDCRYSVSPLFMCIWEMLVLNLVGQIDHIWHDQIYYIRYVINVQKY